MTSARKTRDDIDLDRLGYMGLSWGGAVAPVMLTTEDRISAAVIIVGGLLMQKAQPMADPFHFLPRVRQPTVMISARYDSFYPLETSGRPLFDYLGTPVDQKRLVVIDANHGVLSYARNQVVGEALEWLDTYFGGGAVRGSLACFPYPWGGRRCPASAPRPPGTRRLGGCESLSSASALVPGLVDERNLAIERFDEDVGMGRNESSLH